MISRALSALGLMKRSEHEDAHADLKRRLGEAETARDDWEAKFKLAATDLAKQAEEIARLNKHIDDWQKLSNDQSELLNSLRPDALLWRAARDKRSRDRKKGVGRG